MTAITLSNINKRFGEKVLFRDYSLHIEAGEFVAIKGESGAGKTTLLNIIGLLETPDSGSVTLCGARNPSFSSRAAVHLRRHKLSYLFQNYGLVDTDTVEANMKLATRFGKAKGKGVSFMENAAGWHGKAPNDEEYEIAMADLEKAGEALCQK